MADDLPQKAQEGAREALRLPEYLPYRLSVASNKASGLIARAYQARFGLSIWQWRIMAVLGEGRPLTAQGLAEATAMDKVMVSRAITVLVNRRLVTRTPNATDKRAADVMLTREGEQIYAEVAPVALAFERSLLDGFSDEERAVLGHLLDKLDLRLAALESGDA